MRTGNLVTRLQAKYDALQKALGEGIYDVPPKIVERSDPVTTVTSIVCLSVTYD